MFVLGVIGKNLDEGTFQNLLKQLADLEQFE